LKGKEMPGPGFGKTLQPGFRLMQLSTISTSENELETAPSTQEGLSLEVDLDLSCIALEGRTKDFGRQGNCNLSVRWNKGR
jgi:hypothetical protein